MVARLDAADTAAAASGTSLVMSSLLLASTRPPSVTSIASCTPAWLAHALELRRHFGGGSVGQLLRHRLRLGLQLDQHLVDRLLADVDAALERGIDLDVEP